MERKEKKGKTKYGKRRTQSIPTDILIEILLRLPEKSVDRFRCVSKFWSSIINDSSFISSFETRHPRSQRPHLLLCFQNYDDLYVSSIPHHTHNSNRSYSSSLSFANHHMSQLPHIYSQFSSTESIHGLICFKSETPIVWNPSTRMFITLPTIPQPCKHWGTPRIFLGYDPVERKHKVVCIPRKRTCYVCRVFTLGSAQESWRTVKINLKHQSRTCPVGRCIRGVIYYIASTCKGSDFVVMSFDIRSEKFNMIKLPSGFDGDLLITYKGRLACFSRKYHNRFLILEDAQKHKWSSQIFFTTLDDYSLSKIKGFDLVGFSYAGEFIYVPDMFSQLPYILLCDPVRHSWRRFEFKRGADDKRRLLAFPNHTDSQKSL